MNQSLARLSQQKPVLGIAQLTSAVAAVATFFLFYIVFGSVLWIAGPIALAVLVALWQLLVVPVQKQVIKAQVGIQSVASIEKKIASLQSMADRIPNRIVREKVQTVVGHFRYAMQIQQSKPEPLAAVTAQTLTGVALGSTCNLISSYLNIAGKSQLNSTEQQTLNDAESFINDLAVATEDQVFRLKSLVEGGIDAQTGIEANMSALQMVLNMNTEKQKGAI